jgi:hypothetical protein
MYFLFLHPFLGTKYHIVSCCAHTEVEAAAVVVVEEAETGTAAGTAVVVALLAVPVAGENVPS